MVITTALRQLFSPRLNVLKNFQRSEFSALTNPLMTKNWDDDSGVYKEAPPVPPENPNKRSARIFLHDIKSIFDTHLESQLEFSSHVDVCIIGGGVMGSSIAYFLKNRIRELKVTVIEKDPTYTRSSTVLSVGGLRQQFSLRENIEMSLFSAEFLRRLPEHLACPDGEAPDVKFNPHGYLFLATAAGAEQLAENYRLQTELGAKIELMTPDRLKQKFPWINTDGIELASHGLENEGWFDPWSLLVAFRQKAISLGVEYVNADVIGFEFKTSHFWKGAGMDNDEVHEGIDKVLVKTASKGEVKNIKFANCVLAAGFESGKIAEMARIGRKPGMLSVPLPVEPRKRYVYCFHAPNGPGLDCPLVIDPCGAYFRREGYAGLYLAGQSPPICDEPNCEALDVDYNYFDNCVWPKIAHRAPGFNNIKLKSAWAGYYDYNSFDQNAIIGPHPYYPNFYLATGFSGHGIQQAPAVGRAMMEMILDGEFVTIDLSKFNFERFVVGHEVREKNIV